MSRSKQILMLSTSERGGIASAVDWYVKGEIFRRWNARVLITHVEGSLAQRLLRAGISYLQFLGLLLAGRVGAVHCHVSMYGSFWRKSVFAETARLFKIPVVFHLHGSRTREFYAALPEWAQRFARRQLERSQEVLVLSESWREFVCITAPGAKVTVVPNCVELPALPESRPAREQPAIRLLFLGLVGERKGVYDLLPAFAKALQSCPQLRLTIGGNGEVEQARAQVRELGIESQVDVCGWVEPASRARLLQDADVFLLPSYNEGLPMSVLEAMAHKLPVITTPVGGIPELMHDHVNGLLVPAGDVEGLTQAIVELAGNAQLRLSLGSAAWATVRQTYSGERTVDAIESVYRKLGLTPRTGPQRVVAPVD